MTAARKNVFASTLPEGESLEEEHTVLCPVEVQYVWLWFKELGQSRQSGMSLLPISYLEMESWARLSHVKLFPFEVSALRALDTAYIQHFKDK